METNITLQNSSEFYLNNDELFLRSIPAKLKVGPLTTDALRLLVYYVTKASPYELAVETGHFEGTLEQWLESLQSNLSFKATVDTYSDLANLEGLAEGDLVFVIETGKVYPFTDGGFAAEENGLHLTGDSAYQLAKKAGYVGTEAEWLESLKMTVDQLTPEELDALKGEKGDTGDVGLTGDSAYTVYVKSVSEGETIKNVPEWLESLTGPQGDRGLQGNAFTYADFTPEQLEALAGPKGDNGDRGLDGLDGQSAYLLAVELGYVGDEASWILSLKGATGAKGDQGSIGPKGDTGDVGAKGDTGLKGDKGDKGDAFVYADFTPAQLTALTGPQGPKGEDGVDGIDGAKGDTGAKGDQGLKGDAGVKGDTGAKGDKGDKGDPGTNGTDGVTQNATTIVLTGLATDTATPAVATDTLLIAIGKLQAQINALEARVATLETP